MVLLTGLGVLEENMKFGGKHGGVYRVSNGYDQNIL